MTINAKEHFQTSYRSETCASLRKDGIGQEVTLAGWVHRRRDLGNLIFVDLRDRYGRTQLVFNSEANPDLHGLAKDLRPEYVIQISGTVVERKKENVRSDVGTGEIEVMVAAMKVLSKAQTPPFAISEENINPGEDIRLEYRYLDLRRPRMARNLKLRHSLYQIIRRFFDRHSFVEVETPVLMKSTPEGARDYLVPSRLYHGRFYALPQSPQLYKQLLMISGFDRYFQIVKCFRDEDLRADRQPEFTQVDVEMSFVDRDDVLNLMDRLMAEIFRETKGVELQLPIQRLSYAEALSRYGSDKPDLRFGMEINYLDDLVGESGFRVFRDALQSGGTVGGIRVEKGSGMSRKQIDELTDFAKQHGVKGLAWVKVEPNGFNSPISKFLDDEVMKGITTRFGATAGDLLLLVADKAAVVAAALGQLRLRLANDLDLIRPDQFRILWVVDFPLYEYDEELQRYFALHHPFTAPMDEDVDLMDSGPADVRAKAYDLVLNGNEVAGGSIRIHRKDVQEKMFRALGISEEEAESKFGFFLKALTYGAPPHGGIAFGFDRLTAVLAGEASIRDVIAFPKNNNAASLMDDAPSPVDQAQLSELGLKLLDGKD